MYVACNICIILRSVRRCLRWCLYLKYCNRKSKRSPHLSNACYICRQSQISLFWDLRSSAIFPSVVRQCHTDASWHFKVGRMGCPETWVRQKSADLIYMATEARNLILCFDYTYTHTHTHTHTHIYIYIYIHTYTNTHIHPYISTYVCMYVYLCNYPDNT
jgi:hypothetical protein